MMIIIIIIIIIININIGICLPQCWLSGCEEKKGPVPDSNGSVPSKVLVLEDLLPLQKFIETMTSLFPKPNWRKTTTPSKNLKITQPKRVFSPTSHSLELGTTSLGHHKLFSQATDAAKIAQRPKRLRF